MFASRLKPAVKQLYVVWRYSCMKWMQLNELRGSWIVDSFYIGLASMSDCPPGCCENCNLPCVKQQSICVVCSSSIRILIMSMTSELVEKCFQHASSFIFCSYFIEHGITVAPISVFVFFSCLFIIHLFHLIFASLYMNHEQSEYILRRFVFQFQAFPYVLLFVLLLLLFFS